ncbi:GDSL-like Lipase/Acylhydrolase [Flexibacter flexilis DSM 6793]|uniref:GDSL-like Lipase/Acylhydrolase n=1 Tax=Flexibacter flexilis DSM 6793 TaxID=927664 RepID=A0A1I1MDD2_9BACT|nr:SGNH/GDSL hydrolase family protein [Flexibacter flexilis]SFC83389.1 GDSL-like Lipase/Acylhydrolase [Flexibacter flexilis DSM 6793]
MKSNKIYNLSLAAAVAMAAVACEPKLDAPTPSKGDADFSHYVALGNSLTAGYADGALYKSGQVAGYANMIATQMKAAGGGEFKIPYIKDENGIGSFSTTYPYGMPRLALAAKADCKGVTSLSPSPVGYPYNATQFSEYLSLNGQTGPFNNLGVPGAKSYHLGVSGYGNAAGIAVGTANPFYARFATSSTSSVIQDALAQSPTFFTLWIGNNDILGYATSGGQGNANPGMNPATYGSNDITPTAVVKASIEGYVQALKASAKAPKGVLAGVPDVLSTPYFNTVKWNGLALTDANTVAALNTAYASLISAGIVTKFVVGNNPFIIADVSSPAGFRSIKSTEYLILTTPSDSIKCKGWGSQKPIPASYVLDATEVSNVSTTITSYNDAIKGLATTYGLAYVDAYTLVKNIAVKGYTADGVTTTTTFASGGAFSLDGVHLTPRGNAIIANAFIEAINAKYGSTLSPVDAAKYNGVVFPK